MSKIDWSKAPEWATHGTPEGRGHYATFWRMIDGTATEAWVVLPDGDFDHVLLPAMFERDRKELVERPSSPAWNGEGLPPVGVVCEAIYNSHGAEYHKAKILAHDDGTIVFRWIDGDSCGLIAEYKDECPEVRGYAWFRPIRTPEQIAAEERETAVDALCYEIIMHYGYPKGAEQYRLLAEKLHDAGYRKTGEGK